MAKKNIGFMRGKKLNDDEVKILLLEVQSRMPLWNLELPLEQRRREIIAGLWQEVSKALNGRLSPNEAKSKFKSLRDTHRRVIANEHRASESPKVEPKEKWKFYKFCEFLRDPSLAQPTSCNVTNVSNEDDYKNHYITIDKSESITESLIMKHESTSPISSKQSRESQEANSFNVLNRIADKICSATEPPPLPTAPTIDAVDNFMTGIGHQIRKLPESVHFEVIMEIMALVHEKQRQYLTH